MRKGTLSLTAVAVFLLTVGAAAADEFESNTEKLSYLVGYQFGQNIRQEGIDLDKDAFMLALEDALNGTTSRISFEEAKAVMSAVEQQQQQERAELAKKNKAAGEAFLKANRNKKGVIELPSGLQYKIIKQGKGKKPTADDIVAVNYRGTLINGKEFDSSYKRGKPVTFKVNEVIPGWQEILQLMPTGSKWEVFVPPKLAYGEQGAGHFIGPNETLIFDIELLEVKETK